MVEGSPSAGWEEVRAKMSVSDGSNSEYGREVDVESDYSWQVRLFEEMPEEFASSLLDLSAYMGDMVEFTRDRIEEGQPQEAKGNLCHSLDSYFEENGVYAVFQDTGEALRPIFVALEDEEIGTGAWMDEEYFLRDESEAIQSPEVALVENMELEELKEYFVGSWSMPPYLKEGLSQQSLGETHPHEPDVYGPTNPDIYQSLEDQKL